MNIFKKATQNIKKNPKGSVTVVIAAGGSGSRMGGVSKPLMELCGRPCIEYSLEAFSAVEDVVSIYISARAEDASVYEEYVRSGRYPKLAGVALGGATRGESVENAFIHAFSRELSDFVAIHDGARPLITPDEIRSAAAIAKKHGSGVCASRMTDTLKRTTVGGCVTETVDRESLWAIATPQIFDADLFHTALAVAKRDAFSATDDAGLMEHAGFKVMLSEASRNNIKITYPEDIRLAEAIIVSRK